MGMFPGDPGYSEDVRRQTARGDGVRLGALITRLRSTARIGALGTEDFDEAVIWLERYRVSLDQQHVASAWPMIEEFCGVPLHRLTEPERITARYGSDDEKLKLTEVVTKRIRNANEAYRPAGPPAHSRPDATPAHHPAASADGVQEAPQPAGSRPGGLGGPRGARPGDDHQRPAQVEADARGPQFFVARDDVERSLRAHEYKLAALWIVGIGAVVVLHWLLTRS